MYLQTMYQYVETHENHDNRTKLNTLITNYLSHLKQLALYHP